MRQISDERLKQLCDWHLEPKVRSLGLSTLANELHLIASELMKRRTAMENFGLELPPDPPTQFAPTVFGDAKP